MLDLRVRKILAGGPACGPFELSLQFRTQAGVAVLFGPSGAGKSLTLAALAGFLEPDEGRIELEGNLLFDAAAKVNIPPRRRGCGCVFERDALFPHMNLRENLAFAAQRLPRLERTRRISEVLAQFHLEEVAGRRPHQVTTLQRLQGSIARAVLSAPRILLLDEPARGLDPGLRAELCRAVAEIRAALRLPVLMVTHDVDSALELGEEMFVLDGGRLLQQGAPSQILDRPASVRVAAILGKSNVLQAEVVALDPGRNYSRLRCLPDGSTAVEAEGPYLPGCLLGDRMHIAVRADSIVAQPRSQGGVPLALRRAVVRTTTVRLEFAGLTAELPRREYERYKGSTDWGVEIPPSSWHPLKG